MERGFKLYGACLGGAVWFAVPSTAAQFTLAWEPNTETNLAAYVLRYSFKGSSRTDQLLVPTNLTTATVSNLSPHGPYTFTITARNDFGVEGPASDPITTSDQDPVIDAIADQSMLANTTLADLAVTIRDRETPASSLTLSAKSSHPPLLPEANIILGGSGPNRTLTLTPVPGKQGKAIVTLTVSDGAHTARTSFALTVQPAAPPQPGPMTNPFSGLAGQHQGLFYEADQVAPGRAGFFSLKTTSRGAYSGRVLLGQTPLRITGQLDVNGRATNQITRPGTNTLALEFQLSSIGNSVSGRVSDGAWEGTLLGDRAAYSRTSPAPFAGRFTLVLPGSTDPAQGPEGYGFGTAKVDGAGFATFVGSLADGSKVAQRVGLSAAGVWPLYVPLHQGRGLLLSWQTISNRPTDDIAGRFTWVRPAMPGARFWPAGFTHEAVAVGSSYVPPTPGNRVLNLTETKIIFTGGSLAANLTNTIILEAHNQIVSIGAPLFLSFSLGSGLFSGKVTEPLTGKRNDFRGAVLQKQTGAAGYLLGTNQSAQVRLGW